MIENEDIVMFMTDPGQLKKMRCQIFSIAMKENDGRFCGCFFGRKPPPVKLSIGDVGKKNIFRLESGRFGIKKAMPCIGIVQQVRTAAK